MKEYIQYSIKKDNQTKITKNSEYIFRAYKTYSSSVQRDNAARTELRIPNTTDQEIGQVNFQKVRLNSSPMIPMISQNRPTQLKRDSCRQERLQ